MMFARHIIYPENDYRKEFNGAVKDGHIPHGQGTLTLKNGKEFNGDWVDGACEAHTKQM